MFRNHQKLVSAYGRENPEQFARVLKFVVLSIRTRLFNLPADMATLDAAETGESYDGVDSILYGSKRAAIDQINAERDALYWQAESIVYHAETEREAAENLLDLFTGIHGLGLAKAGFCAQLLYGVSACLDSHNVARYDLKASALKSSTFKNAKTLKTRRKWISRYCDMVETLGGTELLWDTWCEYVFNRPDETGYKMNGNQAAYKSPFHVSALHALSLGIETAETESAAAMADAA